MKRIAAVFMMIVMALGLTACGSTVGDITLESGQSAIYIKKDDTVSYAVSEKFDKDYYDEDDLEDKIEKEVSGYNEGSKASVNDAVSIKDFDVKKDAATLVLDFATTYDFMTYIRECNNIEASQFYIGGIADNSDCKIKGNFVSPDKKKTADAKEIKKMTEANILIVNDAYKVQIEEGAVLFVSDNCKIDEDGIISTPKGEDGTGYIVYNN